MKLIHVTSKANYESIKRDGFLDPSRAAMKRKAVWAVSPSNEAWAILHTIEKPRARGLTAHDHIVIELDVPRSWLRRHARGVWYCYKAISVDRFAAVREASETATSYPA